MRKQVIDILPPSSRHLFIPEEKKQNIELARPVRPAEKSLPRKRKGGLILSLFLLLILVVGGVFCYFTLSRATVDVWPKTQSVNFKTKLTIDSKATQSDFDNKVIPGQIYEKDKTTTERFNASGRVKKETKASGKITVYNETISSQNLVTNTRFVSADGKVFRSLKNITVPAGHNDKGKIVAGQIEINVSADKPGADYNIGPSTFSIPGFAGSDKYTKIYGKSVDPMTGGIAQEVAQVTEKDIEDAKNTVTKKAKEDCEAALRQDLAEQKDSAGNNFVEQTIQTDITDTFSSANPNTETDSFDFQAKAKSEALIFKQDELNRFAKQFILSQAPAGKQVYGPSLNVNFQPETVGSGSDKVILSLDISAKIYSDVDINQLKNSLRGKSQADSKSYLEFSSDIDKAQIELWPFWVSRIPDDLNKVTLNLKFD